MWHDVRQLRKNPQYLEIQESLRSKNLTQSITYAEEYLTLYVACFSLPWKIGKKQKVKEIIELAKTSWLSA